MDIVKIRELLNGETVEMGNKGNLIFLANGFFVVELLIPGASKRENSYEIADAFSDIEDAIKCANEYTSETYPRNKK